MNQTEPMDEHIADRCVAGLKTEYHVSTEDEDALRVAILNHMKLTRTHVDAQMINASAQLMAEITERIKANAKPKGIL